MAKTVATKSVPEATPNKSKAPVIRVEESMEDFVRTFLPFVPHVHGIDVKPLWSSKDGKSRFYRINYWRNIGEGLVPTRKWLSHRFIRVDTVPDGRALVDLTVSR